MTRLIWLIAGVFAVTAVICPLAGQNQDAPASRYDPATFLLANVRSGTAKDAYWQNLLDAFQAVDTDRNGLDRDDIDRLNARLRDAAFKDYERRLEQAEREIGPMDANGDGGVTEKEITDADEYQQSGRAHVDKAFEIYDTDRDGLIALTTVSSGAGRHAQAWIEADSNRDGSLSKQEMLAGFAKTRPVRERSQFNFAEWDINGDGIAMPAELAARYHPDFRNRKENAQRSIRFERLFVLDNDSNGVLSEGELTSAFLAQFARLDRDGDGTISPDEERAVASIVSLARDMAELPFCAVPAPLPNSDVLAVLANEGQLASAIAVGGQESETSIVDVRIEPGDRPLFVLLLSRSPVIWDFQGDTQQVANAVVFSQEYDAAGNPLVGLIGVPKTKIVYGPSDCLPIRRLGGFGASNAVQLENQLGAITRLPVRVAAGDIGAVILPSLSVERFNTGVAAPEGFDPDVWWSGTDTFPRGIADPDPAAIASATSVERYNLLPGDFGLARLVHQGVIAPTTNGGEFRLLKPLDRFPGGLKGSSGVSFVLSEGIARPKGELGRGCLYAPNGKTVLEGDYCRQYPRGNAVQIRMTADGKSCLFRYGGENAGCFPDDGRPLRMVETDKGQEFKPVRAEEVRMVQTVSIPEASRYRPPIEIIPAGLRQNW